MLSVYELLNIINSRTKEPLKNARSLSCLLSRIPVYEYDNGKTCFKYKDTARLYDAGKELVMTDRTEKFMDQFVNVHYIPKSNGKRRCIVEYDEYLHNILDALLIWLRPIIEPQLSPYFVGCRTGYSIKSICNGIAEHMQPDSLVCHLDVKNWFNNIKTRHVVTCLEEYLKGKFELDDFAKTLVSEVLTYHNRLTQGSPCSPLIANAVASMSWGKGINEYCLHHNLFCRIYLDDITFIYNGLITEAWGHVHRMADILRNYQFTGHKFSVQAKHRKQKVLGLIMNKPDAPRVAKKLRKRITAIVHKCTWLYEHGQDQFPMLEKWASIYKPVGYDSNDLLAKCFLQKQFTSWIMGQIAWIGTGHPQLANLLRDQVKIVFTR